MKSNNEYSFIRELFTKLAMVVLTIVLLLWLFPLPGNTSCPNVNYSNQGNSNNSDLSILYNRIFNENIQLLKETAKNYFTVERMPKADGESKTLYLREMLDMKLLLSLTDKNGAACDTNASYVEVTKKGNEYTMKVTLSCGGYSDYIIEYIGCHDFCGDCSKTETNNNVPVVSKVKQYQYKKQVTSYYWGDWSGWTDEVISGNNDRNVETKNLYIGKKWVEDLVYEYEYLKTGSTTCQDVQVKIGTEPIYGTVTRYRTENYTEQEWVSTGSYYNSYRSGNIITTIKNFLSRNTIFTPIVNYLRGGGLGSGGSTSSGGSSDSGSGSSSGCTGATCGIPVVQTPCTNCGTTSTGYWTTVTKTRSVPYEETIITGYRDIYENRKDCHTSEDIYLWSQEKSVEGYTATGNKRVVTDKGSYTYTDWVESIPDGYTQDQVKTQYRYQDKKSYKEWQYRWSSSENDSKLINSGWSLTGKTREIDG